MKTRFAFFAVLLAVTPIVPAFAAPLSDCPSESLVVTQGGYYGAVNPDAFRDLETALARGGDKGRVYLETLKSRGIIYPLPPGQPACVIAENSAAYSKRVAVPGLPVPVWVQNEGVATVR